MILELLGESIALEQLASCERLRKEVVFKQVVFEECGGYGRHEKSQH